jgi:hypothetical protein
MSRVLLPARSSTVKGVKIVGPYQYAGRIAASASLLYARNLFAFLETLVDKTTKALAINVEDELVKATMLTMAAVVHPNFQAAAPVIADPGSNCLRTGEGSTGASGRSAAAQGRNGMANEMLDKAIGQLDRAVGSRCAPPPNMCRMPPAMWSMDWWRRDRSVRVPLRDLRPGDLRRLLRRLVGHAGTAYAADGGHQRDFLRHRRRCAACRRHRGLGLATGFGFVALVLASVNIFGGFLVTQRMLAMYKKKDK